MPVVDTLKLKTRLANSGMPEPQAQVLVEELDEALTAAVTGHLATKSDIADVRGEIAEVRGEVAEVRGEVAEVARRRSPSCAARLPTCAASPTPWRSVRDRGRRALRGEVRELRFEQVDQAFRAGRRAFRSGRQAFRAGRQASGSDERHDVPALCPGGLRLHRHHCRHPPQGPGLQVERAGRLSTTVVYQRERVRLSSIGATPQPPLSGGLLESRPGCAGLSTHPPCHPSRLRGAFNPPPLSGGLLESRPGCAGLSIRGARGVRFLGSAHTIVNDNCRISRHAASSDFRIKQARRRASAAGLVAS